jgi:hypothetical protein
MPSITYNGYTLPQPLDTFAWHQDFNSVNFSCNFLVSGTTEADLVTLCTAAELALKAKYKNLVVLFGQSGNNAEYNFSHTANTGFLAEATLDKLTDRRSTALTRAYKFSVSLQLPADQTGYNGRREAKITYNKDIKGRATCTVTGQYTAIGILSASQAYHTYGELYSDGIANSFIIGAVELLHQNFTIEQEDKLCSFTRQYWEKLPMSLTYNGYTLPYDYNSMVINVSYNKFSLSCEFAISHALAGAVEEALRIKYKTLDVSYTGFLADPKLDLISNTTNNDTIRFYKFSLTAELPANSPGYNFRRDGNYTISYDSARRQTAKFNLQYTAGGSSSASVNARSGGPAFATGVLSGLSGSFELVGEQVAPEMEDKLATIVLTYREVLFGEGSATFNEAGIVNNYVQFYADWEQERNNTTGGYNHNPQVHVRCSFSCDLDKTVYPNATGERAWRLIVRPWIISKAYSLLGLNTFGHTSQYYIVNKESLNFNPSTNGISGAVAFTVPDSSTAIVYVLESITYNLNEGRVYHKLWDAQDYTYLIDERGKELLVNRTIQVSALGSAPHDPDLLDSQTYVRLNFNKMTSNKQVGYNPRNTSQATLYSTSFFETYLRADSVMEGV